MKIEFCYKLKVSIINWDLADDMNSTMSFLLFYQLIEYFLPLFHHVVFIVDDDVCHPVLLSMNQINHYAHNDGPN